jgi:hypothetical protein
VELSSSSALLLGWGVFRGVGLATSVGRLSAGRVAEALGAAAGWGLDQTFDAEDDDAAAALAGESGPGETVPVGGG